MHAGAQPFVDHDGVLDAGIVDQNQALTVFAHADQSQLRHLTS